jgi:hypothetical protein
MTWRASNENERPGASPRKRRCKPHPRARLNREGLRRPAFRGSRSPLGSARVHLRPCSTLREPILVEITEIGHHRLGEREGQPDDVAHPLVPGALTPNRAVR